MRPGVGCPLPLCRGIRLSQGGCPSDLWGLPEGLLRAALTLVCEHRGLPACLHNPQWNDVFLSNSRACPDCVASTAISKPVFPVISLRSLMPRPLPAGSGCGLWSMGEPRERAERQAGNVVPAAAVGLHAGRQASAPLCVHGDGVADGLAKGVWGSPFMCDRSLGRGNCLFQVVSLSLQILSGFCSRTCTS